MMLYLKKFATAATIGALSHISGNMHKTASGLDRFLKSAPKYEGWKAVEYKDTKGVPTIGYGFNLYDKAVVKELNSTGWKRGQPLNKSVADSVLRNITKNTYEPVLRRQYPNYDKLGPEKQEALLHMAYGLGQNKLKGFKKMNTHLSNNNWSGVRKEMLNSQYAKDIKSNRANYIANLFYNPTPKQNKNAISQPPQAIPSFNAGRTYTINSGDTLSTIAQKNNMSLQQLLSKNPSIKNPNRVFLGQEINI